MSFYNNIINNTTSFMIIQCISCSKKFNLDDELLPPEGSKVRCGSCSEVWFYNPNKTEQNPTNRSFVDDERGNNKKDISELENELQKNNEKTRIGNFKIFGLEEESLSKKDTLDKEEEKSTTEKKETFLKKIFKKKKTKDTTKAINPFMEKPTNSKKEKKTIKIKIKRILFYFLFLISIIFCVVIVEFRDQVEMAYPFLSNYFDLVEPLYKNFIKKIF